MQLYLFYLKIGETSFSPEQPGDAALGWILGTGGAWTCPSHLPGTNPNTNNQSNTKNQYRQASTGLALCKSNSPHITLPTWPFKHRRNSWRNYFFSKPQTFSRKEAFFFPWLPLLENIWSMLDIRESAICFEKIHSFLT